MTDYQIFFRKLSVMLPLGLHDFERTARQRVELDLVIHLALADRFPGDPSAAYDYDRLHDFIVGLGEGEQIMLQEGLCQRIIEFCRSEEAIKGVAIRTAKPDVYRDAQAVGCVMTWGVASAADLALADG